MRTERAKGVEKNLRREVEAEEYEAGRGERDLRRRNDNNDVKKEI